MASSFDLFHKSVCLRLLYMCLGWLAAAPRAISFSFFLAGPSVLYLARVHRLFSMVVRFAF